MFFNASKDNVIKLARESAECDAGAVGDHRAYGRQLASEADVNPALVDVFVDAYASVLEGAS